MNNPKIKQLLMPRKNWISKELFGFLVRMIWRICNERTFGGDMSIEIGKYEKIEYAFVLNSWHVAKN